MPPKIKEELRVIKYRLNLGFFMHKKNRIIYSNMIWRAEMKLKMTIKNKE